MVNEIMSTFNNIMNGIITPDRAMSGGAFMSWTVTKVKDMFVNTPATFKKLANKCYLMKHLFRYVNGSFCAVLAIFIISLFITALAYVAVNSVIGTTVVVIVAQILSPFTAAVSLFCGFVGIPNLTSLCTYLAVQLQLVIESKIMATAIANVVSYGIVSILMEAVVLKGLNLILGTQAQLVSIGFCRLGNKVLLSVEAEEIQINTERDILRQALRTETMKEAEYMAKKKMNKHDMDSLVTRKEGLEIMDKFTTAQTKLKEAETATSTSEQILHLKNAVALARTAVEANTKKQAAFSQFREKLEEEVKKSMGWSVFAGPNIKSNSKSNRRFDIEQGNSKRNKDDDKDDDKDDKTNTKEEQ